jgi:hypothetical protein
MKQLAAGVALMLAAASSWAGGAIVHRLARDSPPQREMAAVVAAVAGAPVALAARLASAGTAEFAAGTRLMLLSTGPVLDQPDQATALAWQRDGWRLSLTVEHSHMRAAGQLLERNLGWRPLLQAPLPEGLPPGDYTVSVHWLSPGTPRVPELSQTLTLRLRPRTP